MTKARILLTAGTLVSFLFVFAGCADLKDELPAPNAAGINVHPAGWTDTTSENFHGKAIADSGWNMTQCKSCHGATFAGGTVNVSCRDCHTNNAGPENCATCHGSSANPAPPEDLDGNTSREARSVGAHQAHLIAGKVGRNLICSECHTVPSGVNVPGHIDSPRPAEVNITSAIARTVTNEEGAYSRDTILAVFTPAPTFDPGTLTCANTYCHGNFKNGNPANAPVWNVTTPSQVVCGSCHGDPSRTVAAEIPRPKTAAEGGTHPTGIGCSGCHAGVVDANRNITDKSKHINGRLTVFGAERDY